MPDSDTEGFPTLAVAGREFVILQVAAIVSGLGLVFAYFLRWVAIVGEAWPATPAGEPPVVVQEGSVGASEISILPELIAVLGVITFLVSILWWNRYSHLVVVAVGFLGTGITLFMREGLQGADRLVIVGDYEGWITSFEPGLGMWVALAFSALLIGVGFGAFLNTFDDTASEGQ